VQCLWADARGGAAGGAVGQGGLDCDGEEAQKTGPCAALPPSHLCGGGVDERRHLKGGVWGGVNLTTDQGRPHHDRSGGADW